MPYDATCISFPEVEGREPTDGAANHCGPSGQDPPRSCELAAVVSAEESGQEDEHTDYTVTRLRMMLDLWMQGHTQAEIAEKFGVTPRTIRNWLAEARRRGIGTLKNTDPADYVSRSLYRLHKMDTDLMGLQQKAEQRGRTAQRAGNRALRLSERKASGDLLTLN